LTGRETASRLLETSTQNAKRRRRFSVDYTSSRTRLQTFFPIFFAETRERRAAEGRRALKTTKIKKGKKREKNRATSLDFRRRVVYNVENGRRRFVVLGCSSAFLIG